MAFLGRRPTGSVFLRAREWPGNICAVRSGNGSYYRKTGRTVRRELASSMGEEPSADSRRVLSDERTKWIAKVLRQIGKIRPGMRRRDLLTVFTTEGGISTRTQRTYVHTECPYIKVTVRFKAVSGESPSLDEDPDDIIESVSQPFLAWSVMD